jgi:hypothetical protein
LENESLAPLYKNIKIYFLTSVVAVARTRYIVKSFDKIIMTVAF